ncbi:MAG: hypothetical protein A3B90_00610 [Candidatus Magasanikbacteria bacterium RIFCSPHIGHO2_02_FULL_41_13]|uniref:Fibronectin type-III domain-containing protein n=1 Tax=Candidatus Magasanikbacteria bacterium RIFCSPHIGHO2_02_FULL_41_13 TaxID=1798676 RepID=A0A1F6M716_9BACT|nr:MAG: hypothetical protein A3B90_00610 [Candidatus Magasanikbacteria bacterium RIFCSPHIGHO2_02_FULL_41_13]
MNQKSLILTVAGTLLLIGAGCSGATTNPQINTKPAETTSTTSIETATTSPIVATSTEATATPPSADSVTLTGKALGNGMVQFNWTIPEGAKNPRSFHIVRGQNENPTQPPSFWFKQDGTSRSAIWAKLAKGEQHFRVCTWETNKCEVYSNDILVDVK